MYEGTSRPRAEIEYRRRHAAPRERRPDRIALWALVMAIVAMLAAAVSAHAGTGGTGVGGGGGGSASSEARYSRIWEHYTHRDKRWARQTSECESGGNPRAIGGGGRYRGAFQFTRPTWKSAPKSPGGDPIRYSWRTQAVVAVSLKHREGKGAWPVCG